MYIDEPDSWNHIAIDSLNRLLLGHSVAIIVSLKKKKKKKKKKEKWRSWLTTILSSYKVQSVSSFRRHLHCIVGKSMDFPDLKQKQAISYSGVNWRVVHANQELDLSAV